MTKTQRGASPINPGFRNRLGVYGYREHLIANDGSPDFMCLLNVLLQENGRAHQLRDNILLIYAGCVDQVATGSGSWRLAVENLADDVAIVGVVERPKAVCVIGDYGCWDSEPDLAGELQLWDLI